ncbi:MAG: helix-turn-helix transcriptional regulator [Clostridia bacterium]|nr:helix-turn-helix transcriptional regulator [Clostridia bacterium]
MYLDYKKVGSRIAARRKELGLKQWQVNEMAGLSDKYLSNIERGTSVMSLDVLMKLCTVLQTTPDNLLLGALTEPAHEKESCLYNNKIRNLNETQKKLASSLLDWIASLNLSTQ